MWWAGWERKPARLQGQGSPPGACIISSSSKATSCALRVFRDTHVQSEMRGETLASLGPSALHSNIQGQDKAPPCPSSLGSGKQIISHGQSRGIRKTMFGHSTRNHQRRYGEETGKHRTIEEGGRQSRDLEFKGPPSSPCWPAWGQAKVSLACDLSWGLWPPFPSPTQHLEIF